MPVLEILQLRFTTPPRASTHFSTLVKNLITFASRSNSTSKFYTCIEDPAVLYILSTWPFVIHRDFLSSPGMEGILSGPSKNVLEFLSDVHIDLPTVAGSDANALAMPSFASSAPVVLIARLFVRDASFQTIMASDRPSMAEATEPHGTVDGWRTDAEPEKYEYLVIAGWKSVEAHKAYAEGLAKSEQWLEAWNGQVLGSEFRHVKAVEI